VAAALAELGRVDIVVNNAGILRMITFPETTLEDFTRHFEVHVAGSFNVTRAAWPHLAAQGYGRVVMTTSNGILGLPVLSAYGSAKGGVLALMRALATSGAPLGIRVNAICPWATTRMVRHAQEQLSAAAPDDDLSLLPEEAVSPAVAVLAHEACPVNGEVIFSAGGVVARFLVVETLGYRQPGHTPEDILDNWDAVWDESGGYTSPDAAVSNDRRRAQILGA
jgi:NAD(P)-dependent dehydrogenase (short-subunit alcohol dehydrogenase family)